MNSASADITAAIMASDQVIWRVDASICDQCQDVCWAVEGHAQGALGNDYWRTPVAWAPHLTQAQALRVTSRTIGRNADKVRMREEAIHLRETQPALW